MTINKGAFVRQFAINTVGFLLIAGALNSAESKDSIRVDGTLHTPQEIVKLLDQSVLSYELGVMPDSEAAALERSVDRPVLTPGLAIITDSGRSAALPQTVPDSLHNILTTAEDRYKSGAYAEALTLYRTLLEQAPSYYQAYVLIGDAFFAQKQFDSAASYFQIAIEKNFVDYQAHWFLADAQWERGDTAAAVKEMTIAHLLNVNHSEMRKKLKSYRLAVGRPWIERTFRPVYRLSKEGNKVSISVPSKWLGYALTKALWRYEPGYSEKMVGGVVDTLLVYTKEEFEAITCTISNNDSLKYIVDVAQSGLMEAFLDYEIVAPSHPLVMLGLSKHNFDRVVEYVNKFH